MIGKSFFNVINLTKHTNSYPFKKKKLIVNYQGFPEIQVKDDCINCLKCQKACPTKTIKFEKIKQRVCVEYKLGDCMSCFVCRAICPQKRIGTINEFELASTDKEALTWMPDSKFNS